MKFSSLHTANHERVRSKALVDAIESERIDLSNPALVYPRPEIPGHVTEGEETMGEVCLDKWTHKAIDTVTAVAISQEYISWASKLEDSKYGIFIRDRNSLGKGTEEQPCFSFQTENIIQDLEFTSTKLIGVDFMNNMYTMSFEGKNLEAAVNSKKKMKIPILEGNPTSVTVFENRGYELTAIGTSFGKVLVFNTFQEKELQDNNNSDIELMAIEYVPPISSSMVLAHFLAQFDCDSHVRMVVAEKSGCLRVYRIEINNAREKIVFAKQEFEQKLDLNIEFGKAIASSESGNLFVIRCGDKKVRLFRNIPFVDVQYTKSTVSAKIKNFFADTCVSVLRSQSCESIEAESNEQMFGKKFLWELSHVFDLSAGPLAVSLSSDGERLAVGKEDRRCDVFDVKSGCKIRSFNHGNRVRSVDLDKSGKYLMTGDFNYDVNLFNIEAGFDNPQRSFQNQRFGTIQSVSLDDAGKQIAIGTGAGHALVFRVSNSQVDTNEKLYEVQKKERVYVVKLSGDGQVFAYGGYDCRATLVKIPHVQGPDVPLNFHDSSHDDVNSNYIWGLDIKENFKEKLYVVAVGSWDKCAYVYFFTKDTLDQRNSRMLFQHEDRVYDVAMSLDASLLLVGGRDKKARLYKIPVLTQDNENGTEQKENICILTAQDDDRIYCVAISPLGDYIAYGGTHKQVNIYQVQEQKSILVHKFNLQHTIHRLSFMDGSHLAAVSEDGSCVLYRVDSNVPVLHLNLGSGTGNSLAFSSPKNGLLAIAHGCAVTIYGKEYGYGPFDRPSFEVAAALLGNPEALKIALESHPTLTNAFSNKTKKSLLSIAVESGHSIAVDLLLDSEVPSGLFIHKEKDRAVSALTYALQMRNRNMMDKLLKAISSKKIVNSEHLFLDGFFSEYWDTDRINQRAEAENEIHFSGKSSLLRYKVPSGMYLDCERTADKMRTESVGSVFKAIALYFPTNFLEFMSSFEMDECDTAMLGMIESAQLEDAVRVLLPFKSPKKFWQSYMELMENESKFIGPFLAGLFSKRLPHHVLQAQRIPFPGICNTWEFSSVKETPLEVIVHAASTLQEYSVFDKRTIVHDLVMYYWEIHSPKFLVRTFLYFIYYCFCIRLSAQIAEYNYPETEIQAQEVLKNVSVHICIALIPMGMYGLYIEYKQLQVECQHEMQAQTLENSSHQMFLFWKNVLRRHFDIWNTLDFLAYFTELITNVLFLAAEFGYCRKFLHGFAALSILFLTWKWLFYARAFSAFGPFMRMIQRVILDMRYFLFFMFFWLFGFALSFHVLLANRSEEGLSNGFITIHQSISTVLNMLYGDFNDDLNSQDADFRLYHVLFNVLMLSSVVIMLNLVVAILNEAYQKVNANVHAEYTFQLAGIVLELVKAIRQKERDAFKGKNKALKWVHKLSPKLLQA